MKTIKLTRGQETMVDDEDFEYLNQWKWFARKNLYVFYAVRHKDDKAIFMHRVLMNTPKGMLTDHVDGNGLNNQKSNLRVCTPSQNECNKALQKNNTTGFKGVHKYKNRYLAQIHFGGKRLHLGSFVKPEDAYKVYCEASKIYHKEFSRVK